MHSLATEGQFHSKRLAMTFLAPPGAALAGGCRHGGRDEQADDQARHEGEA